MKCLISLSLESIFIIFVQAILLLYGKNVFGVSLTIELVFSNYNTLKISSYHCILGESFCIFLVMFDLNFKSAFTSGFWWGSFCPAIACLALDLPLDPGWEVYAHRLCQRPSQEGPDSARTPHDAPPLSFIILAVCLTLRILFPPPFLSTAGRYIWL